MVWDATKSPGDLITSSDWNDMVADQKTRIENNAGVDIVNRSIKLDAESLVNKILPSGETYTIPVDYGMVVSNDYTVNGTLEVNGSFSVVE